MPCDTRDRDWSDAVANQETPRVAGNYQVLGKGRKDCSLEPSEGAWPCVTLILQLWALEL